MTGTGSARGYSARARTNGRLYSGSVSDRMNYNKYFIRGVCGGLSNLPKRVRLRMRNDMDRTKTPMQALDLEVSTLVTCKKEKTPLDSCPPGIRRRRYNVRNINKPIKLDIQLLPQIVVNPADDCIHHSCQQRPLHPHYWQMWLLLPTQPHKRLCFVARQSLAQCLIFQQRADNQQVEACIEGRS